MKKILIPIGALLLSGFAYAQNQSSSTENYVYTKTYLDYNISNVATKYSETVQYFDGLGRPKQVINVKASPQGKDVVTPIVYDDFGRQVKDYLPVPQQGTLNGAIIVDPLANILQTPYGNEKIYSEKQLENSPLDRILGQKQVGNAWNNKPVQFGYDANTTADAVKKYTTVTTWVNAATSSALSLSGNYTTGQLYKITVTDEDGNKTIEFKNGQGQLLLVRKVNGTENVDTYYVYNEYNQLAYVIPPLASVTGGVDEATRNNLCYQYRYDGRGRLVEKKLPGKGWEYIVYDKADRIVLTQDANMKAQNNWLMTKYDQLGRVIYTGIVNSGAERIAWQNIVNDLVITESRDSAGFTKSGMTLYYSNTYFTSNITSILTINYYDTYPGYYFNPSFPPDILGQSPLTDTPNTEGRSTKSLPVMSLVKNVEDDNWTKNYTYYDQKVRAIGSYSINHLGGRTKVDSKLDFAGVVQQTVTRHKRLDTDTDRLITENFTYDHQNRLLTHTHQVDSNPVEYLAQNTYNELSQVTNKKVGGIAASSPLQSIDYSYNIRGWMTKINDPSNLNGKLFGYEMRYTNPVYSNIAPGRFNGNISEIDWATQNDNVLRRYDYNYDELNRFNFAQYSKPNMSVPETSSYNEWATYDLNGNIKTMGRYGLQDTTQPLLMDHLKYTYVVGNRLNMVNDISQNPSGYPLGGNIISYDENGNMTSHLDKGINEIKYNFLNLPNAITAKLGTKKANTTQYIYRADGVKVSKSFTSQGQTNITDYLNGFQYITISVGPELQFVPTKEGYFDFIKNKYIYNYTDHLGNVRISYFNNGSGMEVLEEHNYYAFGLKHEGYNVLNGNPNYNYKYNGKELQETGMYDYGARFYMPDLGRWGVVDPLAEKMRRYSPYNYGFNNPIMFIDPDGRQAMKPTPKEAAAMAAHVYGDKKNGILIGGWKVSDRKFEGVQLENQKSGFKSQIYERTVGGKTEYTYATAGTEADWGDVGADVKQPLGLSTQYSLSASNAQKINEQVGNSELTFTGHSLGGGLAALNANLTGNEAITFNAAGVGKLTKYTNGSKLDGGWFGGFRAAFRTEGLINAYIMRTDPLNTVQNNNTTSLGLIMPDVNGKRHYITPTTVGSLYNGHSMDNMLKEFGINPNTYAE